MHTKGPVCVTGAAGFLGSHLVRMLLREGYTVRGLYEHEEHHKDLMSLPGAQNRLQLIRENLLDEQCFDEAFQGCVGVFHTESPMHFEHVRNPEEELLKPAKEGTLNVLKAARKAGVETVVLTSSIMAAVYTDELPAHGVFSEDDWSNTELMKKDEKWYHLSKTIAENEAWHFMNEASFRLVTVLPGMMFGPLIIPSMNYSSRVLQHYLTGQRKEIPNKEVYFVDVRDVAKVHLLVYENQSITGRVLVNGDILGWKHIATALRNVKNTGNIPSTVTTEPLKKQPKVNIEKLHTFFGVTKLRGYEHSIEDTVHSLFDFNLVPTVTQKGESK